MATPRRRPRRGCVKRPGGRRADHAGIDRGAARPAAGRCASALFGALDCIVIDELHAFLQGSARPASGEPACGASMRLPAQPRAAHRPVRHPGRSRAGRTLAQPRIAASIRVEVVRRRPGTAAADPGLCRAARSRTDAGELRGRESSQTALEPDRRSHVRGAAGRQQSGVRGIAADGRGACRPAATTVGRGARPERVLPASRQSLEGAARGAGRASQAGELPTTAVATTTLELGIDIGSVKSVAQVGAPRSLASLRQRLGRSGRRRACRQFYAHISREKQVAADSDPLGRLRLNVVRAVAAVRLLLLRFVEPPGRIRRLRQWCCIRPCRSSRKAEHALSGSTVGLRSRPAPGLRAGGLHRAAARHGVPESLLIEQARDGTIMLGEEGEALILETTFPAATPAFSW